MGVVLLQHIWVSQEIYLCSVDICIALNQVEIQINHTDPIIIQCLTREPIKQIKWLQQYKVALLNDMLQP